MSEAYKKLIKTLRTLFEMDKADLDFGIYRILNQKRDEIDRFLEHDLLPQVKTAFADYAGGAKSEVQAELDALIKTLTDAGMDPEQSPKVAQLRAQAASAVDITAVENEAYSHLHTFFSRYYDQGDFISQRRYKADTYAIPYEGEEVKLYWANHDQYYVKSSEHLRDYAFTAHDHDGRMVRIKLVEADTEKDNVKTTADQERRFVLDAEQPLHLQGDELQIRFQYVPAGGKKQAVLNAEAGASILAQKGFDDWLNLLRKPASTEANPKRTLLDKHLNDYTARNTFDYFIHKDLGGFLRRELDFYIKSEVLHLDDVDDAAFAVTEAHLRKIKVMRSIAHKIIQMLAHIENFQKKLWLKKKFVVSSHYCVTLDRVPESLYHEIATNERQWAQWQFLGVWEGTIPGTIEDMMAGPYRMVDASLFDFDFEQRLLSAIEDIEASVDGVLIQADNFQGISLLGASMRKVLSGIYIDPPYNTDASPIAYKNGYQHSSWASLFFDRMTAALRLLNPNGSICVAIDDFEYPNQYFIMNGALGLQHAGTAVVRSKPQGRPTASGFSANHEYAVFWSQVEKPIIGRLPRKGSKAERYPYSDHKGIYAWANFRKSGTDSDRSDRKRSFYPVYVKDTSARVPAMTWSGDDDYWIVEEEATPDEVAIWPVDAVGKEKVWTCSEARLRRELEDLKVVNADNGTIELQKKYRPNQNGALPGTWWDGPEYSASESGTKVLKDMFDAKEFDFPKSISLVVDNLRVLNINGGDTVLDYFAGSGTTGCATLALNREDGGNRKYILIEQGQYFDTVLHPRIQKAVYSAEWKNGKPTAPKTGISHCFKVLKLEGYEDALNNLLVRSRTKRQQDMLEHSPTLREDYLLGYWMDVETADSPSLLNVDQFEDPFNYKLNIATGSVGAFKPTVVDLVETFSYMIGLRVKHIDSIRGFKVVTGTNPQNESVLVIWRKVKEQDNAALEAFMDKQGYNPRDTEFDRIYVNGDHTLEDPQSKVKMTEIEFKRLMFDVQDV